VSSAQHPLLFPVNPRPNALFITQESTSTQNGKNIYRKGAKYAKDVKNKRDFAFLQGLQGFLSDRSLPSNGSIGGAFAVPSSTPACPG
jgi:hypothetical protein